MTTNNNPSAIPDLTIMSHQNWIQNSELMRMIANIHITNNRTIHTKQIKSDSLNGDDILKRPAFAPSANWTLEVDRASITFDEFSGAVSIDRQQFQEGSSEVQQYVDEAVRSSSLQVLHKYYNSMNTILTTAGNYVGAREQAATAAWSTTATATPYKDVLNLKKKIQTTGKINRYDSGLRLLLSENLADEVIDTDDYKDRMNRVNIVETGDIVQDLSFYFKTPVVILKGYYYGENSEQLFNDDLAILVWQDLNNRPDSGIINSQNLVMDNSTLIHAMKDLSVDVNLGESIRRIPVNSLTASYQDQLLSFSRPVLATWEYMSDDGISMKFVKTLSDGAMFINDINKLGRLTGV